MSGGLQRRWKLPLYRQLYRFGPFRVPRHRVPADRYRASLQAARPARLDARWPAIRFWPFILEPQPIASGSTSGVTGRLGVRSQRTILGAIGGAWQFYRSASSSRQQLHPSGPSPCMRLLCRSSGTNHDSVHVEDGPPITQRTSGPSDIVHQARPPCMRLLCRSSGTNHDSVHVEDGPPITQRTSGLIGLVASGHGRPARHRPPSPTISV